MRDNLRLSVIIPMYQSEGTISECIKSVCDQKLRELEIICVDDGSTDNTCDIVMHWICLDARIQLIRKEHGGVSSARNVGIDRAQGGYLLFLDADDMLCAGKLAATLRKAEKMQADILVFSGTTSAPYGTPLWIRDAFSAHDGSYHEFFPKIFLQERSCRPSACNKLYRRCFVWEHAFYFPDNLSLAEDHVFQFLVFPEAHNITFTRRRLYFYRIYQTDSAMGTYERNPVKRQEAHFQAMQFVYKHWAEKGYFMVEGYPQVYVICYLDLLFAELLQGDWQERCLIACRIYQDLLPLEDVWGVAAERMEIVSLLYHRELAHAKKKLELYNQPPQSHGILQKIKGPVRYVKRVGIHSAIEHYVGRLLHTEP